MNQSKYSSFHFIVIENLLTKCIFILVLLFQLSCNNNDDTKKRILSSAVMQYTIPKVEAIEFEELKLPTKQEDFTSVRVSPRARIRYNNGTYSKYFNLEYKTLFRSGDTDAYQNIAGGLKDKNGNYILESDGSAKVSVQPDGNSIFLRNGKYHLMTHFENYPGAIYMTELDRKDDGSYTPKRFRFVDFSTLDGTVFMCAASHTSWDTHLAGEEDYIFDGYYYDPQVAALFGSDPKLLHVSRAPCSSIEPWTCEQWDNMRSYTGLDYTQINNYNYGYMTEISVDSKLGTSAKRHYSMGKYTPELAAMMPDNKTAYMTDDGSFGGFYMYIADKASDLSSGTLYMAKWTQLSAYPTTSTTLPATYPDGSPTIKGDTSDGGRGALTWVKLGSATDAEVKAIVDKRPTLSDIFQIGNIPVRTSTAGAISTQALCGALGVGYKLITAGAYDVEYRGINMCLRLRDGNNGTTISSKFSTQAEVLKAAAFLETRKYGSYLGATAEFEKEEGIVYNPDSNVIYMTMGRLRFGMDIVGTSSNSFGPSGGDDHVQLDRNDCGAIYEIKLGSSQKDTSGNSIGSSFTGTEMKSIIVGKRLNAGELYADKNRCHPDYISLPDALNYSKGTLFIGEDSSSHFNNSAWAYDLAKKKLTRIMTIPTGSEFTGNFVHLEDGDRLNIFVSVQHPYSDEVFDGNTEQPINWSYNANATKEQKRAYIGYIYGLPRLTNTTNTTYTPDPNQ